MGDVHIRDSVPPAMPEERQAQPQSSFQLAQIPYPNQVSPLSPWTHVAIFSSVLAPVALLPYLAVRRHLLSLHRKVSEVGTANAALQRDLKAALLESSIRRDEHDRLASTMGEFRRELERLRAEQSARALQRARVEERIKADISELLEENKRMRYVVCGLIYRTAAQRTGLWCRARLAALRDLSPSLADIAAFMHEVEVQGGFAWRKNDGRGIERIRQFAYKLQNMLTVEAEAHDVRCTCAVACRILTQPRCRTTCRLRVRQRPPKFRSRRSQRRRGMRRQVPKPEGLRRTARFVLDVDIMDSARIPFQCSTSSCINHSLKRILTSKYTTYKIYTSLTMRHVPSPIHNPIAEISQKIQRLLARLTVPSFMNDVSDGDGGHCVRTHLGMLAMLE